MRPLSLIKLALTLLLIGGSLALASSAWADASSGAVAGGQDNGAPATATQAGAADATSPPGPAANADLPGGAGGGDVPSGSAAGGADTGTASNQASAGPPASAGNGTAGTTGDQTSSSAGSSSGGGQPAAPSGAVGADSNPPAGSAPATGDAGSHTDPASQNAPVSEGGSPHDPSTQPQAASTGGGQPPAPAAASSTTQQIWQVQVSGCTAYCQGTSQSQAASQQSTTVQVLGQSGTSAASAAGAAGGGTAATITQIQLGCLAQCFGSTTIGSSTAGGLGASLQQLLSGLVPGSPSSGAGAGQQSTVDQTSYQWQDGGLAQTQIATQTSTSIQVADVASALISGLESALRADGSTVPVATASTSQEIRQLQIGCLIFCTATQQTQVAQQSSLTLQALPAATSAVSQTTSAVLSATTQLIWQLQIGCVFWCYDATQSQVASIIPTLGLPGGPDPPASSDPPPAVAPEPGSGSTGGPPTPSSREPGVDPAPASAGSSAAGPANPSAGVTAGSGTRPSSTGSPSSSRLASIPIELPNFVESRGQTSPGAPHGVTLPPALPLAPLRALISNPGVAVQDLPSFTLIPWHVVSIAPALFGITGSTPRSSALPSKSAYARRGGAERLPQLQLRPSSSPGALGGISAAAQVPGGIDSLFVLAAAGVALLGGLVLLRRQALATSWNPSALRTSTPPAAENVAAAVAASTVATHTARTLRNDASVEAPPAIVPASQPDPPAPAPAAVAGSAAAARPEHGIGPSFGPLGAGLILLCGVALLRRLAGRSNDK
jgi:hypothetical protein